MGMIDRLSRIIRANLNDLISRSDEPEKVLNQSIMEMETGLKDIRRQLMGALAQERFLNKRLGELRDQSLGLEARSREAYTRGEASVQALFTQRAEVETNIRRLEEDLATHRRYIDALGATLGLLEQKLSDARLKKEDILRYIRSSEPAAPEQRLRDRELFLESSAFDEFDRIARDIEDFESKTSVWDELEGRDADLEREFRALEKEADVDEQLRNLKKKMGY